MSSSENGEIINVSPKGQATIPKHLRDRFGIETPGRVFIYEKEGKIIVEPLPAVDDLHGAYGDDYDRGEVLERLREMKETDKRLEGETER